MAVFCLHLLFVAVETLLQRDMTHDCAVWIGCVSCHLVDVVQWLLMTKHWLGPRLWGEVREQSPAAGILVTSPWFVRAPLPALKRCHPALEQAMCDCAQLGVAGRGWSVRGCA